MKKIFKIIRKILRILIYLMLMLFILLFYNLCRGKIVKENYYEISMNPQYERKEIPNTIEEINFDYSRNLIIDLKNLKNNLYLKSIVIYKKDIKIGEIHINEDLENKKYIKNYKFKYSIDDELFRILGKENEKYIISSGPYMESGFIFEIIIVDKKNSKVYNIKREMSILFVKKGRVRNIIFDH